MTKYTTWKYVRHSKVGFVIWPKTDNLWHSDVGQIMRSGHIISAGFADIYAGEASCYGRSESLDLNSRPEDSEELTKQLFT